MAMSSCKKMAENAPFRIFAEFLEENIQPNFHTIITKRAQAYHE